MKKFKTLIIAALASLALVACGPSNPSSSDNPSPSTPTPSEDNYQVKILAPKGAPSLAFYDMAADDNFETAEASHIKEEFGQKNYDMIVMEFFTGLNTVKKSNSNYRLARILTGGNLYLVSRSGKTTAPTSEDKVLAFGPGGLNGIPYLSLRKLYPEVNPDNIICLADGASIQGALISGKYAGSQESGASSIDVDYVVIPQPALAGAMAKLKEQNITPSIVSCLRDEASKISNGEQKWVLQAGLFVHKDLYNEHKAVFEAKFAQIDKNIETVLTNPEEVKTFIETALPDVNAQKQKFSCPTPMIPKISKNPKTPNGFGFISKAEWDKVDVQSFISFLGKTGPENNFEKYFLAR